MGDKKLNPFEFRYYFPYDTTNETTQVVTSAPFWVKEIRITIDGKPLDVLNDKFTKYDCSSAFFRFCRYLNMDGIYSTALSYDDFKRSYFFAVYSLNTTQVCY